MSTQMSILLKVFIYIQPYHPKLFTNINIAMYSLVSFSCIEKQSKMNEDIRYGRYDNEISCKFGADNKKERKTIQSK
ncbi:Uncharacterised protein [Porphyromonas cangingivalis]|nr:Uncharacterised protein [Porphyromonas cangingivalis]